jgi:hypothetical protein
LRMNAAAQAAVGAGHDFFSVDHVGEGEDAVGPRVRRGFSITKVRDPKKNNVAV